MIEYIPVNERWEKGIPHDPRSIALYEFIAEYDATFLDDSFYWKSGGDGDNGETLMYILDEYFTYKDIYEERR